MREVNWKTGFNLTIRDANWVERLKIILTGVVNYSKPFRVQLDAVDPDADQHLEEIGNQAIEALQQAVTNATFRRAAKLTLHGLANAIITRKPFLLLLIDETTYTTLVETNPQIQDLADDLYQFFAYRAAYMSEDYNENTKKLLQVSHLGKGDALTTWAILNEFATEMYNLDRKNKLTPETEKSIHIWKLNSIFERVRNKVKVEKRAAKMAAKDPENKVWIKEQTQINPKKLSVRQAAKLYLQNATEEEIKKLMDKHLSK